MQSQNCRMRIAIVLSENGRVINDHHKSSRYLREYVVQCKDAFPSTKVHAQRPMACRKLIESIVMYRRDTLRPHCIYAAAKMQLGPDARQRQRRRLYKLCIWAEILLSENEHARNSVPRNYCNSICGSRARLGQARPFRVQNDGARNACTYIVLLSVLILVAHMHGMRA